MASPKTSSQRLSKFRWFFVIARNSTFAYKEKAPDVRQVARDLGVRYILEGSVRKSGERLRITGQLIDATKGAHVWAERYDRAVTDIFAIQDEITQNVVSSIESQVFAAENLRVQSKAPESLDAWGCVMRAMPYIWTWAPHDTEIGLTLLKRAAEIDPNYARASSLLAWGYAARAHLGRADPATELKTALVMARRAIEQDSEDPWAHLIDGVCSHGVTSIRAGHSRASRSDRTQSELRLRAHDPWVGMRLRRSRGRGPAAPWARNAAKSARPPASGDPLHHRSLPSYGETVCGGRVV